MSRRYATRVGGECDARRGVSRPAPPRAAPMPQLSSRGSGAQPRWLRNPSIRLVETIHLQVWISGDRRFFGGHRRSKSSTAPAQTEERRRRHAPAFPGPRPGRAALAATQERTSRVRTLPGNMAFVIGAPASLTVRAATHVNPKATKHHTKTRPKKVRAAHRAPQDRPPKTLNPETRGPGRGRARASPARARAASTSPPRPRTSSRAYPDAAPSRSAADLAPPLPPLPRALPRSCA